jgi:hypothetical protein
MKTKTLILAGRITSEALKEGRREGRREGRAEGARDAAWQAVLRALRARHGTIPEGLVEAVEQVDYISHLEMLLERAVLTSSLEEFAAGL